MFRDVLLSAYRLPLLFRGDVMRPSSLAALVLASPPMLLLLALKVRSGMRVSVAGLWAILGIYASWAAGLLFEPSARAAGPYLVDSVGRWINVVPFTTIAAQVGGTSGGRRVQFIGNVVLLLPLGLIGPVLMRSLRSATRLVLAATGVSIAIELVQLVATTLGFVQRSVDVDDVILNVAGALIGWLLWRATASVRGRVPWTRC